MAVKLRLARMGKKKQPFYKIVAADSRTRRDGKYIEKIGYYNPLNNPAEIIIDEEKAFYWLKNGAIPTDTVKSLFSQKGLMLKWHYIKDGHEETKIGEEYKKWELLQLERKRREEALAAQQAQQKQKTKTSDEEPIPETPEEAVAKAKEETGSAERQDTVTEKAEIILDSPSESNAPDKEAEAIQPDEKPSEAQQPNEPDDTKEQ